MTNDSPRSIFRAMGTASFAIGLILCGFIIFLAVIEHPDVKRFRGESSLGFVLSVLAASGIGVLLSLGGLIKGNRIVSATGLVLNLLPILLLFRLKAIAWH